MRRLGLLAGIFAIVLAGSSITRAAEQKTQPRTRHIKIVTLGDSITKGVRSGVQPDQTFAALLEKQLQADHRTVEVVNVGIGGERTDQAWKRLSSVMAPHPDFVTIMYGTNDSYVDADKTSSRISVEAYRANLRKIVTELLRHRIQPVLMTEPRWADDAQPNGVGENPNVRLEKYVAACREVAGEWRLPLVDHFANWSAARDNGVSLRQWTTDGCHPNPLGHKNLATALEQAMRAVTSTELRTRDKLLTEEPVRIVCFGDSVTGVYYHTGSRRAYTEMLGIALRRVSQGDVQMVNSGISGNTTVDALRRIDGDVIAHKPDLVTVMFGLNDLTRVSINDYRENLKTIVAKCRAAGAEVMLLTPNNVVHTASRPVDKLVQYCDVVRDLGRELQVPVCDCFQDFDAIRAQDEFDWGLIMSDAIHPNMDGHKRIAELIAQRITGHRCSLSDVPPQQALTHTQSLLADGKPIKVLAMPPYDLFIVTALRRLSPEAMVDVTRWDVSGLSIAELEQRARTTVRTQKPDLVVIAVPRTATADSDAAFRKSFGWIMNWSLNFGQPTWDCIVVHPSMLQPAADPRDALVRRLVQAQDLPLVDRMQGSRTSATQLFLEWFEQQAQ